MGGIAPSICAGRSMLRPYDTYGYGSREDKLRNDDAGEAAEMGVRGDELGLADAGRGVDDGVGAVEAMVEAHVRGCEGDGLVQRDDFAEKCLGGEPVRERPAAMLREVPVDFEDDHRRDEDRGFAFEVMAKGRRLRVFGQVFEPAGGVNKVEFRTATCGHDNRLSI